MGVQHSSEETVGGVSLETADRTGSDHQGLGLVSWLFPRPQGPGWVRERPVGSWESDLASKEGEPIWKAGLWGPAFRESSPGRASGSSLTEGGIGPQHLTGRRIVGTSFLQG